jgi:protoporphyrinogen oxidase
MNKIKLSCSVESVDAKKRQARLSDGTLVTYDKLFSTIPLDLFASMVTDLPEPLKRRASSSNIVGVGLKGQPKEQLATKCWMYFPEANCPFYRVTLFSKYSPNNVPDSSRYFSLMTETSESSDKKVDHEKLVQDTIDGLLNTKLIASASDVVSTWVYRASYGYPTPSLERDSILNEVQPALDALGAYSRGRFGGWKYEVSNQDHTFMQGVEWAAWIAGGEQETTYKYGS